MIVADQLLIRLNDNKILALGGSELELKPHVWVEDAKVVF